MGVTFDKILGKPLSHKHGVGDVKATGTASSATYLRGDGAWATPAGSGSGTVTTIKEAGVQVGDADIVTLDFDGTDFDLTETPDTEINIVINDAGINHNALTNYVANEHIDWTIDQGATNIHAGNYTDTTDHTLLSNIGTNTHAQIDTHLGSTTNPHSVTYAQVGADPAGTDNSTDVTIGTNTATALSLSGQELSLADVFVQLAGDTMTGGLFIDGSADAIQLKLQAHSTQTENIFEIEDSSGNNLIVIDEKGWYGVGAEPMAPMYVYDINITDTPRRAMVVSQTWSPTGALGNVFPTALVLSPTYNSSITPSGGFLTAFRLFTEVSGSGDIPIRGVDLYSNNSGTAALDYINDIRIRSAGNGGGGSITDYYGIWIEAQTAATNNYVIYTAGSTPSSFGGNVGVGILNSTAKLHVDQSSTTGAIPTLLLDQADVSEEFIEFISTSAANNTNPISTTAVGTYAGKLRVNVNGTYYWLAYYNS